MSRVVYNFLYDVTSTCYRVVGKSWINCLNQPSVFSHHYGGHPVAIDVLILIKTVVEEVLKK